MQYWSITGTNSYERISQLQKRLVDLRAQGRVPDTVLFVEHEPVVTQGRGLQFTGAVRERHVPVPQLPSSIAFAESERGGDLTYHGPGQLVLYPICKLDGEGFGPHHDVEGYLRKLETLLQDELGTLGITAEARENATGVWVGNQKVASIGIAVRKWITYHGVAINVVNDLKPFRLFQPCGYNGQVMTNLQDLLQGSLADGLKDWADWRSWLEERLATRLDSGKAASWQPQIDHISLEEAEARLDRLTPAGLTVADEGPSSDEQTA
jgi:lipoyl(octanoyl) transferase